MKIINARAGELQTIPFTLGERGRGRWAEQVQVAKQEDRAPEGPESVGYFTIPARPATGAPEQHVILTRPRPGQNGVLLRINTRGCYTRGCMGSVSLLHGKAKFLTRGNFAYGDAGRVGDATDELWHVEGPTLFSVVLAGGASKGYGRHYLTVSREFQILWWEPDALVKALATGANASVENLVREALAAGLQSERLSAALATLDAIESEELVSEVANFFDTDPEFLFQDLGITAPVGWTPAQGVEGVRQGVLVPGQHRVVGIRMGAGSRGKRWGWDGPWTRGLRALAGDGEEMTLYAIESEDWAVAWVTTRDREEWCVYVADADGIHSVGGYGDHSDTRSWLGGTDTGNRATSEWIRAKLDGLRS